MKILTTWIACVVAVLYMGISAPWAGSAEPTKKPAAESPKTDAKSTTVDINSASVEELKAIKGIDEASARKIVEGRPYKRRIELVDKKILSKDTFDKVRKQIVAKPVTK